MSSRSSQKRNSQENDDDDKGDPKRTVATTAGAEMSGIKQQQTYTTTTTTTTTTKAGWCLRQGLLHIAAQDEELARRIQHHGVPSFYSCVSASSQASNAHCRHEATQQLKDPQTCFEALCRIITGQSVSGHSVQAAWKRLLAFKPKDQATLTPETILRLTTTTTTGNSRNGKQPQDAEPTLLETFQKAVGITNGKARSIHDLALHFNDGRLSEDFLNNNNHHRDEAAPTTTIRHALMSVRGIGPWSCDMFLLFYLELSNIMPLGDLGVRKGLARHFFSASGCHHSKQKEVLLCAKKDAARIQERLQGFAPYLSLVAYYMWRVADTPNILQERGAAAAGPVLDVTTLVEAALLAPLTAAGAGATAIGDQPLYAATTTTTTQVHSDPDDARHANKNKKPKPATVIAEKKESSTTVFTSTSPSGHVPDGCTMSNASSSRTVATATTATAATPNRRSSKRIRQKTIQVVTSP